MVIKKLKRINNRNITIIEVMYKNWYGKIVIKEAIITSFMRRNGLSVFAWYDSGKHINKDFAINKFYDSGELKKEF